MYNAGMRQDRRPYRVKKFYLWLRSRYVDHFIRPQLDHLGVFPTMMKPWHIRINGPNIRIGDSVTIIAEPDSPTSIGVWGHEPDSGRIEIGNAVLLAPGVRLSASDSICIGDGCLIANGVYVTDSDWHGIYDRISRPKEPSPVNIGRNVWLGDHAVVLKGVTIGENSIVAARAVVTRDVPENAVVAGNPAKVVKQLDPNEPRITREEFFARPAELAEEYDRIDHMVLQSNGYINWLRTLIAPRRGD